MDEWEVDMVDFLHSKSVGLGEIKPHTLLPPITAQYIYFFLFMLSFPISRTHQEYSNDI